MSLPLDYKFMLILFKIQGYRALDIKENGLKIEIEVESTMASFCPACGLTGKKYDSSLQKIYIGSLLGRAIYACLKVYRIDCPICGVLTEKHGLCDGKKRYSHEVGQDILRYSELLDNRSVSKLLGISPSTVYRIDNEGLDSLMDKYREEISVCSEISVDEVSYKRKHSYATVLTNYRDARVIWLEKGRKSHNLEEAYEALDRKLKEIKVVAMDFWQPYLKATRQKIPDAHIVFDRFHLSRILNRKLEEERRAYQKQLPDEEKKLIKKHFRWLMLKRKDNLSASNQEHLVQLKKKNEPLFEMYLLKEDFLDIFQKGRSRKEAKQMILSWTDSVSKLQYKKFKGFAKTVLKRIDIILNWFDSPISNGKAEGVNNVIKSLLKRAYGYKDFDYFRAKVLQKCGYLMKYL